LAQTSAGARARAGGLASPLAGDGMGTTLWVWAHVPARRGEDGVRGDDGGRRFAAGRTGGR
jgi:hypothetical protein